MKRKTCLGLVLAMVVSLAGCNSSGDSGATTAAPVKAQIELELPSAYSETLVNGGGRVEQITYQAKARTSRKRQMYIFLPTMMRVRSITFCTS